MITILLAILVMTGAVAIGSRDFIPILFAFIVSVSVGLALALENTPINRKYEVDRKVVEIKSVKSSDGIKGDFFLGTGSVESKDEYYYWTSKGTTREDTVQRKKLEEENTEIIIEEDIESPRIEFVKYQKEPTLWNFYTLETSAIVYVPKGVVIFKSNIE